MLGGTLTLLAVGDRWPFADDPPTRPPVGTTALQAPVLAPAPATADTPDERLDADVTAVADALAEDPDALGPAGEGLLNSLRQVQAAEGPARRLAAVVTGDSVTAALEDGGLDERAGARVRETLEAIARPGRLIDLVAMVDTDPAAIGPAGPELFGALFDLDHVVPADQTAARAAELARTVTAAAAEGRVSETFRAVAVPTLERLADPAPYADLQELLAAAERDPESLGPAPERVLGPLRAVAAEPVWPQGNAALELLAYLEQDGAVPEAFRAEAVPVLQALVR